MAITLGSTSFALSRFTSESTPSPAVHVVDHRVTTPRPRTWVDRMTRVVAEKGNTRGL